MNETYSEPFVKSLRKFAAIKKKIVHKIDIIIQKPLMAEPLKYDLRGLYSIPVSKNFLIIYSYCKLCRKKGDDKILLCHDCSHMPAETVRFFDLGPHEKVYNLKAAISN